jgi:hypothetical protein
VWFDWNVVCLTNHVAIPEKQFASARRQPMIAENRSWQELCVAASQEPDPKRLIAIISELVKALDERDAAKPKQRCAS